MKYSAPLVVRLDPGVPEELRELATADDLTVSEFVRRIIAERIVMLREPRNGAS